MFQQLPDGTYVTPRHFVVDTKISGVLVLDAYRFQIGLRWLQWPFWSEQLMEAAAVHDYLYETARTAYQYKEADKTFVEVAARNGLHPVKSLLCWGALRIHAKVLLMLG